MGRLVLAMAAAMVLQFGAARAESLSSALEKAYLTNASLNAARAAQRAVDERVPQALAGWRPRVNLRGEAASQTSVSNPVTLENLDGEYFQERKEVGSLAITLEQPLFRGFSTTEGTRLAEAQVEAGRNGLLQTEQQVLFDAIQAYMNVYAGRLLVALRKQDVAALEEQVRAAVERLRYGEVVRTDVAQAQARLAEAQNALVGERIRLAQDVASYIQVVGNEPGTLRYPKLPRLPSSLDAAIEIAGAINPRLLAQAFVEVAAQHNIGVARAGLLPSASLRLQAEASDGSLWDDNTGSQGASAGVQLSVPLYDAGLASSQVREAKQRASRSRIEVIEVARDVRKAVAQTWNAFLGSGAIIRNTKVQVEAARKALDGVQKEYLDGVRTTVDVLDAQRELVQSQVLLVSAEKQRAIAAYQLLATIGRLTARDLALPVPLYDPEENYRLVRNKVIGTAALGVE